MEILTDSLHRIAYSTDASAYREIPIGVAYPKTEDDIRWLMDEARRRHTHLIPRAGGTSIAGQVVGAGIVVDVSRYMNSILEINAEERWVRVQPGVVRDELNIALQPYGLYFSPETSTSNRCCIGGMVGNNSCGTHSLIYGSTRHHVIGIKAIYPNEEQGLHLLQKWQQDTAVRQLIEDSFPDPHLRRRSCGYALDECLYNTNGTIDLPALMCGSEGTLGFVTEITLSLDPLPPTHKMVVCEMLNDLNDAWEANLKALARKPVAVELIDGKILELAKDNIDAQRNMAVLGLDLSHLPKAILVSEFWADKVEDLSQCYSGDGTLPATTLYDADVQKVWNLRKAGLGVLTSMPGDAKPVGVIEDTAVAPERLGAYMHDFQAMMKRLGLDCVYYGHISTGELHLRPILDLHREEDVKKFREVATETAKLVKKHKGSLSGEHGDGRLRGEFIPLMYGQEVYDLFCQLKDAFDPEGILNVGKIVRTPPMDAFLRVHTPVAAHSIFQTPSAQHPIFQHIERCNGSGDCRKSNLIGGTLCPAYKVSKDELKTTRARANVLREKLLTDPKGVTSKEVAEVLDSCLACKGCKSECPSNVDMTQLRSEILQLKYDASHTPFRSWMVARMAQIEALGMLVPHIYNWFATNKLTSTILKYILRFAAERQIPTLSRYSLRRLAKQYSSTTANTSYRKRIYLFADEFTNHMEAELGLTFIRLANALGYEVVIPKHVESGRAAISKGCLHLAAKFARKNVALLKDLITEDTPLVGIEPSCILSFRDEYPRLVPPEERESAQRLAKNCLLYDEWLMREVRAGRTLGTFGTLGTSSPTIYLHGHCHQKALVGVEKTADCLRLIPNAEVHVIPSGCCGMAGSFGYEKEHYQTSMDIGEMVLFPAVRKAMEKAHSDEQHPQTIICAPGTSCRQQIHDGTGFRAYHPIEILYQSIQQ